MLKAGSPKGTLCNSLACGKQFPGKQNCLHCTSTDSDKQTSLVLGHFQEQVCTHHGNVSHQWLGESAAVVG